MVHVSVTVDDEHLPTIGEVATQLSKSGMKVEQVLDGVGIIIGEAPDNATRTLSLVAGVVSVDPELRVQLPPPGSSIQ